MDIFVEQLVAPLRTGDGIAFFHEATKLGSVSVVLALAALACVYWILRQKNAYACALAFAVIGSEITAYAIKALVGRTRPVYALFQESSASFPSGHAVVAVSFYFLFVWLLSRDTESRSTRLWMRGAAGIFVLFIGFSRLYLGVHYASDVLVGFFVGGVWAYAALLLSEKKSALFLPQKKAE